MSMSSETSASELASALARVIEMAKSGSGGSRRMAQALLSLLHGAKYKIDLQDTLYVDSAIFASFLTVLAGLHSNNLQLYQLIEKDDFDSIVERWG